MNDKMYSTSIAVLVGRKFKEDGGDGANKSMYSAQLGLGLFFTFSQTNCEIDYEMLSRQFLFCLLYLGVFR